MTTDLARDGTPASRSAGWSDGAFLLLALGGLGVSIYLTVAHYEQFTLACAENSVIDCAAVTHSVYGQLFGTALPVSAAGVAWFAAMGVLRLLRLKADRSHLDTNALRVATCLVGASGVFFALYLVYVELVIVHRICEWCTSAHVMALAIFLLSLADLQQPDRLDEGLMEAESVSFENSESRG